MKTHLKKNCKYKNNKAERKAYIIYHLMRNQITQTQIADELGITLQAVSQFISGRTISQNISQWFANNLNIEV